MRSATCGPRRIPACRSASRPRLPDRPLKADLLERHEFSSQTFVPIDVARWLIVVAPHAKARRPRPRAASGPSSPTGKQGVTYKRQHLAPRRSPCSTSPAASPSSCGATAARATRSSCPSRPSPSAFPDSGEPCDAYKPRRDFVGYGANLPDPKWPNGARLAVNFVMNYEEGSEPSVQDGEDHSDTGLTEAHGMGQTRQGPRPRRREHVRVRQPRRLLAPDAAVPGTQAADDGLRLRARPRAQSRGLGGDRRGRLRHLLARLALDQALRAGRGRGARAHPPRPSPRPRR